MKRRSFLAMLGLAPVTAVAKSLPSMPDPIQLEPKEPIGPALDFDAITRDMTARDEWIKETLRYDLRNFQVAVYDKLRSRDGKLEMSKDGEIRITV